MVILVMFVLLGALAGGFTMLRGERASDDAAVQGQVAASLAETGLQQGLGNRLGLGLAALPGATPDSVRLMLVGGYADIITTRLRAPVPNALPGLYVVRSRGVRTTSGVAGAGDAMQMASTFATYNTVYMTVQSAMTGINGISKQGGSGLISGYDDCLAADGGGQPSLPAVAVPVDPGITGSGPWESTLEGSEKISTIGADKTEAADAVPIDWDAIVNDNAIAANYDIGSDVFPNSTWWDANPNAWPTIIVRNGPSPSTEWALPAEGRGLLIVFGDLNLNGSEAGWEGLILVGGRLRSNGSNEVVGGTVTGLNVKLGYDVEDNDVNELNGTKEFRYHSCNITKALSGSDGGLLKAYRNSWANSYPSY
jgi:hypothetical protein